MRRGGLITPAAIVALLLMSGSAVALHTTLRALGVHLKKLPIQPQSGLQLHTLPAEFPGWKQIGTDDEMTEAAAEELGTANAISRWYQQTDGEPGAPPILVQLHCAYYTGLIETVPHVPERCLVAGGWQKDGQSRPMPVPLDTSVLIPDTESEVGKQWGILMARSGQTQSRIRLPKDVQNLEMNVTPFKNDQGDRMFAGYFFLANGGTVPTAEDVRLLAFKLQDDYAYYCKVQFSSPSVGTSEELAGVVGRMLDGLFADLMRRMPDWVEVTEHGYQPPPAAAL